MALGSSRTFYPLYDLWPLIVHPVPEHSRVIYTSMDNVDCAWGGGVFEGGKAQA
jgi:hypothetical protein